jgi:copper amine oxidase-like protein
MSKTKYLALGLAGVIAFSPMAVNAGNDVMEINQDKEVISEKEEAIGYIEYKGKITDIEKDEEKENMSILVEGEDKKAQEKIVFHITEDMTMLNAKTKEFIEREDLEEGDEITVFFKENTPMTMSIPPQATPNAIIVNDSEEIGSVKVSYFNNELVDKDNELKLNISDDTIIVDIDGDKVDGKHLKDNDLMVFYTITTRSIPAQTTPEKVVVLADIETDDSDDVDEMITALDKVMLNDKTIDLEHEIYKTEDGVYMIALRPISEALGYKVTWNNEERSAELTKGAQWTKVTIGEDNYNFAKMIVKLGNAPEIKDSKTYVPVDFVEEVLKLEVDVNEGVLQIK